MCHILACRSGYISPENETERDGGSVTNELTQSHLRPRIRTSRRKPTGPQRADLTRPPTTQLPDERWLEPPSSQSTALSGLHGSGSAASEGRETTSDPPGGAVGSQHHNAVDEVYAEARHLLGPLIDALDEGEVVHSRDSGLVDYSQSGGD